MNINIIERKTTIDDSIKAAVMQKISKLDKYFPGETKVDVKFSTEAKNYVVEITVYANHLTIRSQFKGDDILASVVLGIDAIEKQINKNKAKLEKRKHTNTFERSPLNTDDIYEKSSVPVKIKRFNISPMSVDEAILQMDMLGHSFFVFKNSDNADCTSVVYTRTGGGYGMIEEE